MLSSRCRVTTGLSKVSSASKPAQIGGTTTRCRGMMAVPSSRTTLVPRLEWGRFKGMI